MVKSKVAKRKKIPSKKAENYNSVLLERMHDDIKLIAEGQVGIQRQLDEFKGEMTEFKGEMTEFKSEMTDFKSEMTDFKNEMTGFKNEMTGFKNEMTGFKNETESNFKLVLEYLSRVEDEVMGIKDDLKNNYEKKGWDKKWREAVEKRLEKIEKALIGKNLRANAS